MPKIPKTLEEYELLVEGKRKKVFSAKSHYDAKDEALDFLKAKVRKLVDKRGRPIGS